MSTWTAEECAEAWGVRPQTFLGYVSRGQAPASLPEPGPDGRRRWDADTVRGFPRPGAGRSRTGATTGAAALLERMRETGAEIEELRERQRRLLAEGRDGGLEISAMASALGISRQTAYAWLRG